MAEGRLRTRPAVTPGSSSAPSDAAGRDARLEQRAFGANSPDATANRA